ncbi:hypothetical protein BH20ACT11_BH20ACT11_14860 [soil metagenome]
MITEGEAVPSEARAKWQADKSVSRAGARKRCTLESGMWLVGGCYNFVWTHCSLGKPSEEQRTPAMAAGLTDHRWSMEELLMFAVPPAELPRWRGRKPKWLLEAENAA